MVGDRDGGSHPDQHVIGVLGLMSDILRFPLRAGRKINLAAWQVLETDMFMARRTAE